jgi:hypothetical protein
MVAMLWVPPQVFLPFTEPETVISSIIETLNEAKIA